MWIWVKKIFGGAKATKEDRLTKIHLNLVSHKSSNARTAAKAASYRKAHPRKSARLVNSYRGHFPGYYDDDDLLFMAMMYMVMYDDFGEYGDMYTEIDTMPEESYSEFLPESFDPADEMELVTVTGGETLEGSADSLIDSDITVAETPESIYTPEPAPAPEPSYTAPERTYTPAPDTGGSSYDGGGSSYDGGGSSYDSGGGDSGGSFD